MKRTCLLPYITMALVAFVAPTTVFAGTYTTDLTAGGGNTNGATVVGEVKVTDYMEGGQYYIDVTYKITNSQWLITETHLDVSTGDGIAVTKKGSPRPGKFSYKGSHEPIDQVTYTKVALDDAYTGDSVNIATHAVVVDVNSGEANLDALKASLPNQADFMATRPPTADDLWYFPEIIVDGESTISGIRAGWCVDENVRIHGNIQYKANVFSTFEDLTGVILKPVNIDLVNWLINQDVVGDVSDACGGNYNYGDVQKTIWTLIGYGESTNYLGAWSQCRVDELLINAMSFGEDFIPSCQGVAGVVLQPVDDIGNVIAQPVVIEVPVPNCDYSSDETAWGGYFDSENGFSFGGRNWATGFTIVLGQ